MKKIILGLLLPVFLVSGVFAYETTEKDLKAVKVLEIIVKKMPEKKLKALKAIIPVALQKKDPESRNYFLISSLEKIIEKQLSNSIKKEEIIDPNWTRFSGEIEDDYLCPIFSDKCKADGYYNKNGKKEGLWKYYYENGELKSEGNFKNGKMEGFLKLYYENGQLSLEGNYQNGKMEGFWKTYHKNGKLEQEGNYQNGEKEGLWKGYYNNGQLFLEGSYKNWKKEGLWKVYYENGKLKEEGNYKDFKKEGLWKKYYENGKIKEEYEFENGKEISCKEY